MCCVQHVKVINTLGLPKSGCLMAVASSLVFHLLHCFMESGIGL